MTEDLGGIAIANYLSLDKPIQSSLQQVAKYNCSESTSEYLIVLARNEKFSTLFDGNVIDARRRNLETLYENKKRT